MVDVKMVIIRVYARIAASEGLERVPDDIERLLQPKDSPLWRHADREDGTAYGDDAEWREFRSAKSPYGLGIDDKKVLLNLCRDHRVYKDLEYAEHLKAGTRTDLHNNIMGVGSIQGTSRAYTLQRLERERPDLLKQVEAGEMSANKAAIEAGFRKVPTPFDNLCRAWKKATDDEKKRFMVFINE